MSQNLSQWPRRTAICLKCRTTLLDSKAPHVRGHETVSLNSPAGRARLLEKVWGKVVIKKIQHPIGSALAFLAALLIASGLLLQLSSPNDAGWAMLIVGVVGQVLLSEMDFSQSVEHRDALSPSPGTPPPPRLAGGSATLGTVTAGNVALTPLTYTPAVAFSVTLSSDQRRPGGALMDSATVGFTITTAQGDIIEIPRGPLEIVTRGQPLQPSNRRLESYLCDLDPLRRGSDDKDPLEHHQAAELAIRVGDHVALHNPIKRKAFATDGAMGGYRDPVRQVFAVEGTPCIELLP